MSKCLFLICPTDGLEYIIKNTFGYGNYFYNSLGNSFICDKATVSYLAKMVETHDIKAIYFVLSSNNKIVSDALGHQNFSNIKGLKSFYKEIRTQKECIEKAGPTYNFQFSLVSYYLNKKIKQLQSRLDGLEGYSLNIYGKVYDKANNKFRTIYTNLVCLQKHHLN